MRAFSLVLARIGFEANVAMPVFFQPCIGVVFITTGELQKIHPGALASGSRTSAGPCLLILLCV